MIEYHLIEVEDGFLWPLRYYSCCGHRLTNRFNAVSKHTDGQFHGDVDIVCDHCISLYDITRDTMYIGYVHEAKHIFHSTYISRTQCGVTTEIIPYPCIKI